MVRRGVRDIGRRTTGRKRLGRGIFLCAVQYQKDAIAARHHTPTPTHTHIHTHTRTNTRYTHADADAHARTHTQTQSGVNRPLGVTYKEASRRDLAKLRRPLRVTYSQAKEASRRDLAKAKATAYVSIRTLGVTGVE